MARVFALVTTITVFLLPAAAFAGESWFSVYRPDHRNWTISVSGGISFMGLEGDATLDESLGDTSVSLDGVLDITEIETFWVEADLQLFRGKHLRAGYTPLRFDGGDTLAAAIVVDGVTYDPGDVVDGEVTLDQYELAALWDFYLTEYLTISPLVQVTLVDAEYEISNETLALSESEDALLPIPYLGVRAEVFPLTRLEVFAEGKGFTIGDMATSWEVQGGLAVHLTKNVSLEARYRHIDYAVEYQDTELDLSLGGAYVGTQLRF